MSVIFDEHETRTRLVIYANVFESEESLLDLKAEFESRMPDSVPVGKRMEVEIYVRIIEDIV